MYQEKIKIAYRVPEDFYNVLARHAEKRGLTVSSFTRYVLKKYIHEHTKKTNPNP